jgi:poly(3-hydroxybutyrate) depolymerase/sugar lactone lactonase YvrE
MNRKLPIQVTLTAEQQEQIQQATGKPVTTLKLGVLMKRRFPFVVAVLVTLCFGIAVPVAAKPIPWEGMVDGVRRTALIEPGKDAATTPSPLVFAFHGGGGTQAELTLVGLAGAWPEATFVYPQGLMRPFSGGVIGRGWQSYPGQFDDGDLRFVDLLLKHAASAYKVDPRRVYATGASQGGDMLALLLTTRADGFAAFAPVAMGFVPALAWAPTPRPVLITHGRRDTVIPLLWAEWVRNHLLRLNECGTEASDWASGAIRYQPCSTGQSLVWALHNGGHDWPQATTENIVRFFKEHALAAAPPEPAQPAPLDTRSVIAGGSSGGFGGDGGPATMAQLAFPMGAAPDPFGNLFITDTANFRIRLVSPEGIILTWAGGGTTLLDANRSLLGAAAQLPLPASLVPDRDGNLFIAVLPGWPVRNPSVARLSINDGTIRKLKGLDDLSFPAGLAVDRERNLYVADSENHRIRKVAADGTVSTFAGIGTAGFSGDQGPAAAAQLNAPWGLAVDGAGNLLIADTGNHRVRKVALDGTISTVAGIGTRGFSGDGGKAMAAQLNQPCGVASDSQGNLFVVDRLNYRVRQVGTDGVIRTVFGGAPEGASEATAPRYYPSSVAIDKAGNLVIADPFNHRVWKVVGIAAPGLIAGQPFP